MINDVYGSFDLRSSISCVQVTDMGPMPIVPTEHEKNAGTKPWRYKMSAFFINILLIYILTDFTAAAYSKVTEKQKGRNWITKDSL